MGLEELTRCLDPLRLPPHLPKTPMVSSKPLRQGLASKPYLIKPNLPELEALMGRKPELRFRFIQDNAQFAQADLDV